MMTLFLGTNQKHISRKLLNCFHALSSKAITFAGSLSMCGEETERLHDQLIEGEYVVQFCLKQQKYDDWSLEIERRISAKQVTIRCSIEVTLRSDKGCIHYCNSLAAGDPLP